MVEDQRNMEQQLKGEILKQTETAQLLASAERELTDFKGIVDDSVAELSEVLHRWAQGGGASQSRPNRTDLVNDLVAAMNAATLDEFPTIPEAPRPYTVKFAFDISVDAISELAVIEQLENGDHDDAINAAFQFNISED
jgi:hypothetical protein